MALDLQVQLIFATIDQLFLTTPPGYARAGAAPPAVTELLTMPELAARLQTFLVADYHQRQHSETGMAPRARGDAGGFLPRLPDSLEQLELLLLTVSKPGIVDPNGIHFQGPRSLDTTLAAYVSDR